MGIENWKALKSMVFVSEDVRTALGMVVQMMWSYDLGLSQALEDLGVIGGEDGEDGMTAL